MINKIRISKYQKLFFILVIFSIVFSGCSIPAKTTYNELYSFNRGEKKKKGFMSSKKRVSIKDFRDSGAYEEDIIALREEAAKYVAAHSEMSPEAKNNLQELKVAPGLNKEQVKLLLGEPDKYASPKVWIYRIKKVRAFTIFIIPVFFPHESYRLYFQGDILTGIERHYLKQMVEQTPAPGVVDRKNTITGTTTDTATDTQ